MAKLRKNPPSDSSIPQGAGDGEGEESVLTRRPPSEEEKMEAEADEKLSAILAEVGNAGDFKVTVKRKSGGQFRHLCVYPGQAFSIEALQEEWGGGEYRFFICDSKGRFIRSVLYSFDPAIPPKAPQASPVGNSVLPAERGGLSPFEAALLERVSHPAPATSGPSLTEIAALITALKPAPAPSSPQTPLIELVQAMGALKTLAGGEGGGEGGGDIFETLALKVADIMGKHAPANLPPAAPTPAAPPTPEVPMLPYQDHPLLKVYEKKIASMAELEYPPADAAVLIVQAVDKFGIKGWRESVKKFMDEQPDAMGTVLTYCPSLSAYREWLAPTIEAFKRAISPAQVSHSKGGKSK